jgi:tetratricopeptide (TPR) repeat protein
MALAFDAKNEKALFRRGQCQLASRNFNEAIEDFQTVLDINPSNTAAEQQIQQCQQEIKAYQVKEKELYHSFLNKTTKKNATHKVRKISHQKKTLFFLLLD